jgi:uncharacterized protein (TIGR02266 family)
MAALHNHNILIHSARPNASDLNTAFLKQPRIQMTTTGSLPDALGDLKANAPDLIIEELHPGDADDDPLCAGLKADARTRGIPVILVVPAEERLRAIKAKPDVLLLKPVVPRELFEAVNRFVPLPTRRVPRYEVNLRFTFEFKGRRMQAFTRNLSLNGAFIKTDQAIPEGSHLRIHFTIPGDFEEIDCGGVVRQLVDMKPSNRTARGIGVEFEGIRDEELARLEAYIGSRGRRSRFR